MNKRGEKKNLFTCYILDPIFMTQEISKISYVHISFKESPDILFKNFEKKRRKKHNNKKKRHIYRCTNFLISSNILDTLDKNKSQISHF